MIGIFDSGSGGLTVLKAIRDELPSADILYLGDIGRAPYGEKTSAELSLFTMQALSFLGKRGVTSIVSACNSVSASLALSLYDALDIQASHIIEMVGPTAKALIGVPGRLLLVATPATIRAGIYENAFTMLGIECEHLTLPELAAMIEFGRSEAEIEAYIRTQLEPRAGSFDVLILACTHYPLVEHIFAKVVGSSVRIFDPALAVAERAQRRLWPQEVGDGTLSFTVTQETLQFRERVAHFFGEHPVEVIALEQLHPPTSRAQ